MHCGRERRSSFNAFNALLAVLGNMGNYQSTTVNRLRMSVSAQSNRLVFSARHYCLRYLSPIQLQRFRRLAATRCVARFASLRT